MTAEIPLRGGRTTQGVVRIGETVRRPQALNSDFASRLLRHLEGVGFGSAPIFLGRDAEERDVLSWIEGEVPADLSATHTDVVLVAAGQLIRRYHDSTAPLLAAAAAAAAGLEVVCHNDLSPCNFVFRDGLPVAIIDFDAAAPGTRAHDLGYAAWLWLDLGNAEIGGTEQRRRLGVFVDAYGPKPTRAEVLAAVQHRQDLLVTQGRRSGDAAMVHWAACCRAWTRDHLDAQAAA